jgi:hypothetical protein
MYGGPQSHTGHPYTPNGQPPFRVGSPASNAFRGGHGGCGGRRLTIDPVVIGRVVNEATGFDKESLNRSNRMTVPTMGPNTNFKSWKRNFLTFMSMKLRTSFQLAIRESGVWLDEDAQIYAHSMLLHATSDNKRDDEAVKCVSATRPDCATAAWDIVCERLDGRSFVRPLSLLDNLMLR